MKNTSRSDTLRSVPCAIHSTVPNTNPPFASPPRRCEIDMYPFSAEKAVLFQYGQSSAALPEEITVLREVTGDADYKNRKLAALQKL